MTGMRIKKVFGLNCGLITMGTGGGDGEVGIKGCVREEGHEFGGVTGRR